MRRSSVIALVVAGCAPPVARSVWVDDLEVAARAPEAAYDLRWNGALIGEAVQRDDGARLWRRERIVVRRGDLVVTDELTLAIDRADDRPVRVTLTRGDASGVAVATARGWDVQVRGEPAVELPPATPFEHALARAATTGGFHGPVLLAGWGFAVAELTLEPDADAWRATLGIDGGAVTARVAYGPDGVAERIESGDGVTAVRRAPGAGAPWFDPIEVVDGSALVVDGAGAAVRFPDARAPIPDLPGQRVRAAAAGGWRVELDAAAPGDLPPGPRGPDRERTIAALTATVAAAVIDDLGATAATVGAARTAARGDCTTHALQFVARADDAGIPTRVVTGLRRDGDRLVRHRWVVAWTGLRWMTVDPTYGESPAAPALIGLAVHGPRAADLAMADAVVFDGLGARALGD
ncbi:MAG: transglutaminase domain-containing protein [Myxococcales bacterium]|nr:transglutaminase domain-containing protein [Myxococcales bacterium]